MIKFVRIATFLAVAIFLLTSFFIVDASHELSLASRAYRHFDMDQTMWHARRGFVCLALGDERKALEDAETALSLNSNAPLLPHFLKSSCLNKKGDHAGALQETKIAYQIAKRKWGFFNSIEGKKWLHYYVAVTFLGKK